MVSMTTQDLTALLAPVQAMGLNVHGTLSAVDYDALAPEGLRIADVAPGAAGVLVLGNGGGALWRAFLTALGTTHAHLLDHDHPLDTWLVEKLHTMAQGPLAPLDVIRTVSSSVAAPLHLNFIAVAKACGMGAPGRLGILMHPDHGPWLALRAALFTRVPLGSTSPLKASPCDGCPAPCHAACHGNAVTATTDFQWRRCQAHRKLDPCCHTRCDARLACPVGTASAYPKEALSYHMAKNKKLLRALLS